MQRKYWQSELWNIDYPFSNSSKTYCMYCMWWYWAKTGDFKQHVYSYGRYSICLSMSLLYNKVLEHEEALSYPTNLHDWHYWLIYPLKPHFLLFSLFSSFTLSFFSCLMRHKNTFTERLSSKQLKEHHIKAHNTSVRKEKVPRDFFMY